jgi:hypothetical protein
VSFHSADEGGFLVTCDGCGTTLEWSDADGGYLALLQGDDPEQEVSEYGWERWEDGLDRCPGCMDEALASGDWEQVAR